MRLKSIAFLLIGGIFTVSLGFFAINRQIDLPLAGSESESGVELPISKPSIDPNFGPGMPTFNPEDPSTYWLAPENNLQLQVGGPFVQPIPGATSDGSPSSSESPNPGIAGNTEVCNVSITALPADSYHQMLTEALIKDLNLFTYVRITWNGGAEVLDLEFLNGYARNAFLLKSGVPAMAKVEISRNPDFAPESLICVESTVIKKVR